MRCSSLLLGGAREDDLRFNWKSSNKDSLSKLTNLQRISFSVSSEPLDMPTNYFSKFSNLSSLTFQEIKVPNNLFEGLTQLKELRLLVACDKKAKR